MCGIYGVVGDDEVTPDVVVRATRTLTHRGPDDEGFLFVRRDGDRLAAESFRGDDSPRQLPLRHVATAGSDRYSVGLGHRRLAILDLSRAGHQPMSDTREDLWVVFNGEIYNYVELRDELACHGHHFDTGTDTEVLLAAYREWGPDFVRRLNGMWAFLMLDMLAGTLIGARDRFGIKPLFWRREGERIEFASEIKALLATSDQRPRPNETAVYEYLASARVDVPPSTFFADVWQVPPAHAFVMSLRRKAELRFERYWYPPGPPSDPLPDEEAAEAVRGTLQDAVRLCLRSDVPVGSCLSGGIDSSSIVSLMSGCMRERGQNEQKVRTFSSCFDDATFDERQYVEPVVRSTGACSTLVFPDGDKLIDNMDALVRSQDEPVPTTSIFAQAEVFAAAQQAGVTVMLDGQGADELFLGYPFFHPFRQFDLLYAARVRAAVHEWLALRQVGMPVTVSAREVVRLGTPEPLKLPLRRARGRDGYPHWISQGLGHGAGREVRSRRRGGPCGRRALYDRQVECITSELPSLLRYEDRNSMAQSIEARVPFLDYRLVELALGLPGEHKIRRGVTKHVLREAMRGIVPGRVLARTDKMGFVTPEVHWLKALAARPPYRLDARTACFVVPESVDELSETLLRQEDVNSHRAAAGALWRIVCLDAWIRTLDVEV